MPISKSGQLAAICLCLGLSVGIVAAADAAQPSIPAASPAKPTMLPDRLLQCEVRHITNYDPHLEQTASELRFDRVHKLVLFLPAIAARTKLPPEPFEPAEPVNPRTRIISDPDGIAPQPAHRFARVVDYWPDRVELAATLSGAAAATLTAAPLLNVIVLNPIDLANGSANLFMTRATELTHFDPAHIYQGSCSVLTGPAARKAK